MEILKTVLSFAFNIFLILMGIGAAIALATFVITLILAPFVATFSAVSKIYNFFKSLIKGIIFVFKKIFGFISKIFSNIYFWIRAFFYKHDIYFEKVFLPDAYRDPNSETYFNILLNFNKINEYKQLIIKPLLADNTCYRSDMMLIHKSGVYFLYHFDSKHYTEKRKKVTLAGRMKMQHWHVAIKQKVLPHLIDNIAYNFKAMSEKINELYSKKLGKDIPCHFIIIHSNMDFNIDTLDGKIHTCKPRQVHKYIKEITKNTDPSKYLTNKDIERLYNTLKNKSYSKTNMEIKVEIAKEEALEKHFRTGTLSISSYNDFV